MFLQFIYSTDLELRFTQVLQRNFVFTLSHVTGQGSCIVFFFFFLQGGMLIFIPQSLNILDFNKL